MGVCVRAPKRRFQEAGRRSTLPRPPLRYGLTVTASPPLGKGLPWPNGMPRPSKAERRSTRKQAGEEPFHAGLLHQAAQFLGVVGFGLGKDAAQFVQLLGADR